MSATVSDVAKTKAKPKRTKPRTQSAAIANQAIDHGQRRPFIVEQLLNDIFQGRLQAGERLVITSLAKRFGVSQSPIREALVTLEGIGIIDIEPNCGAVVRRVTEADIQEVCQVRRALECTAVRLACGRTDLAELHELASAFRTAAAQHGSSSNDAGRPQRATKARVQKAIESARQLDTRLHDLIAESCGNRFLKKELARLQLLFRSFRDVAWSERSSVNHLARCAEEAREHPAIVEALLNHDAKQASRAMSRHIRSGVTYWSRGLAR